MSVELRFPWQAIFFVSATTYVVSPSLPPNRAALAGLDFGKPVLAVLAETAQEELRPCNEYDSQPPRQMVIATAVTPNNNALFCARVRVILPTCGAIILSITQTWRY
jgi:hypothetical protein